MKALALTVVAAAALGTVATACTPDEVEAFTSWYRSQPADCYQAIDRVWPERLRSWARGVVWRESRNQPGAQNARSSAAGCFQIIRSTWQANTDQPWASRYNPLTNTIAAWQLYQRAGRQPWGG